MDEDDIEFVIRQVWGSRCCITQKRLGCHYPFTLARWDESLPPTVGNIVLITQGELTKLELYRDRLRGIEPVRNLRKEQKREFLERRKGEKKDRKRAEKQRGREDAAREAGTGVEGDAVRDTEVEGEELEPEAGVQEPECTEDAGAGEASTAGTDAAVTATASAAGGGKSPAPYELSAETAARVEARLRWAALVHQERERQTPPYLSLEEQVLTAVWTAETHPTRDLNGPTGGWTGMGAGSSLLWALTGTALGVVCGFALAKHFGAHK